MNAQAQIDPVVVLRPAVVVMGEERRRIKAIFPGWRAWQSPRSHNWKAYRDSEPPRFELSAVNGRTHQVSACDEATLTILLEQQVQIDIGIEFPDWRVRRGRTGDWYAFPLPSVSRDRGITIRVLHAPVLWGLLASLRTLARWDALTS
jgi:hypothetical protein